MFIDRFLRFLLPPQDFYLNFLEEIAAKMVEAASVFSELASASNHSQLVAILAKPTSGRCQVKHLVLQRLIAFRINQRLLGFRPTSKLRSCVLR